MYKIVITEEAQKILKKYKKSNATAFKKIIRFMPELSEHPCTGTGHPEPLRKGDSVTYSRRITAKDRLIYDVLDEIVIVKILSIEGHYNDK